MLEFLAIFAFYAACVAVLIAVHETGHYLAGLAAGIPARDMRIRLLRFPQHVELRDGGEWVSPVADIQRYIDLVWRHLKTAPGSTHTFAAASCSRRCSRSVSAWC